METNRPHYSWSQHSLWHTSKREFWKRYVKGEPNKTNKFFQKGKELAEYKETGIVPKYCEDNLLEIVSEQVEELDRMEDEITYDLNGTKILCFVDTGMLDGSRFLEYKTGKEEWDQARVDTHEQLDFYALAYYEKYGKIPKGGLVWVETEEYESEQDGFKKLRYTGIVKSFDFSITIEGIHLMRDKIIATLKEIKEYEYTELELDNNIAERYIYLSEKQKEIKAEIDLIKLDLIVELEEDNLNSAVSESGMFSVVNKRGWSYSDELTQKDIDYKKIIKDFQALEKKNKVATQHTTSTYLKFTQTK